MMRKLKLLFILFLPAMALAKPDVDVYIYFNKPDPAKLMTGTVYAHGACRAPNYAAVWTMSLPPENPIGLPSNATWSGNQLTWYYYESSSSFPPSAPSQCMPCKAVQINNPGYDAFNGFSIDSAGNGVAAYSCGFSYGYKAGDMNDTVINSNSTTYSFGKCKDYGAQIACCFTTDDVNGCP